MKIYLDMVGCRLNQSELESMASQFAAAGHTLVADPSQADLAVVNTCTVTAAAAADSRKTLRRVARSGAGQIIATGCWSEICPDRALELPGVTRVVPNADKDRLVSMLLDLEENVIDLEPIQRIAVPGARSRTRAFIKAQDGCRHQCSFCITTLARGDSRSIQASQVVSEIRAALRGGFQEAVLTGVQLGSWGADLEPRRGLGDLVEEVLKKTDLPRLRLSSLEPWDVRPGLIRLIGDSRVARHLHLPLQSGSSATLRRMGRAITPDRYAEILEMIREEVPGIAITTDILAGFPGESEGEFQQSLDFIRRMDFSGGHVFNYSPREGTPAAVMSDQVPPPTRKARAAAIRQLISTSADSYRRSHLDREVVVLWEKAEDRGDQGWINSGLTDNYLRVEARSSGNKRNTFSRVRITALLPDGLAGEIVEDEMGGNSL
jgi:threonylcarbamoyladenosine tRNA methylthiotransferase MtaB